MNLQISYCINPDEKVVEAVYFRLTNDKVDRTVELRDDVFVDLNRNGGVIGIEMLNPATVKVNFMRQMATDYNEPVISRIRPKKVLEAAPL